MDVKIIVIFLILCGLVALGIFLVYKFRMPKFGCITLITGGVKTGKSMLSVYLAVRKYKKVLFSWHVKRILCKIFKKPIPEKPLLYSNVPLAGVEYTLLTVDVLERRERVAYKSVVYVQEASLVADSQMYKDMELNERLLLFNKLYGHESKGGTLIYDTQCIGDNHHSVRRSLSTYLWIHHIKKIPFFCMLYIREMMFSEDTGVVNQVGQDIEDELRCVIVPKFVWKMYDAYCFSALTDDLPKLEKTRYTKPKKYKGNKLKIKHIVSFRKFFTIERREEN